MSNLLRIIFFSLLAWFGVFKAQAQTHGELKTWAVGTGVGYQHQEVSMMKLGMWALRDLGYANYLRVDGGVDLAFHARKVHYIPELGISYYLGAKGVWPSIKAEITPYTITPKALIGVFNILEFGVGYGFEIQEKSNLPSLEGLSWSIGLSIPFNYYIK